MNKNWNIKNINTGLANQLANELGVDPIISTLLIIRGVKNYEEAREFFRPKISSLHDPFLMKDMDLAINRINLAIRQKEKILIYGDYDVDGTTSVAMMTSFLSSYVQDVGYYIPDRNTEGYGISLKGIDYAQLNSYSLIIALDCGIRAVKQVDYATNKGIDFIICDHHSPGANIPRAIAILNPKQNKCNYPFKELSGCGVGFKLIQGFSKKNNISFKEIAEYLDLLVVSIAADIVDITGENRILAYYGLQKINHDPRIGIKALINRIKKDNNISISDIIFGLAPRINAAGRIDHGKKAVEVLISSNLYHAEKLSDEIEGYNKYRKELDSETTLQALKQVDPMRKSTIVYHADWHKGVIGIVASRLIEKHYKPTIVFAEKEGQLIGSARSVKGFDIYEALLKCEYLLEKFGGHKYAAGLTIQKKHLKRFKEEFEKTVNELITKDQLKPSIEVDMEIDINKITPKLFRIIKQFSPFGPNNKIPNFVSREVQDSGYGKRIGKDKSHLRLVLKREDSSLLNAIGFGMGDHIERVQDNERFDICYSIEENDWKDKVYLQLKLKDLI